MPITVLGQVAIGLRAPPPREHDGADDKDEDGFLDVARELERLKWFVWHGASSGRSKTIRTSPRN